MPIPPPTLLQTKPRNVSSNNNITMNSQTSTKPNTQSLPSLTLLSPQLLYDAHIPIPIEEDDAIFRFSSSGTRSGSVSKNARKKLAIGSRGSKGNVDGFRRGIEVQKLEKRFSVCLKRRKTAKNGSCSSKGNSLFGWGFGVGMMYMMSAGKAEISKLNTAMDETAKVVQELKSELYERKSLRNLQVSSSVSEVNTEPAHTKSSLGNRDPNGIKVSGLPRTDDGECGSSVLTEEPEPEVVEMDQLEAELECELQKLPWCTAEASSHGGITSDFGETEILAKEFQEAEGRSYNAYQSHGVLPSDLDKTLSHLLIEQQESQIVELESELNLAHSKLHEKEAELQALKDCVRRLTEFSLSTVSDEETEKHVEQERMSNWDHNNKMGAESKKAAVGMKRVIDFESCDYYVE